MFHDKRCVKYAPSVPVQRGAVQYWPLTNPVKQRALLGTYPPFLTKYAPSVPVQRGSGVWDLGRSTSTTLLRPPPPHVLFLRSAAEHENLVKERAAWQDDMQKKVRRFF